MNEMEAILETAMINRWARHFSPPPNRVNRPHETDSELVESPAFPGHYLAVTIDTVAEEISEGIYRDPFTAGWVAVAASISDLSAVGADALGLVISVTLNPEQGDDYNAGIAQGMEQACRAAGTAILGGDTNMDRRVALTGCALGLVPKNKVLTRHGCRAGEVAYVSGPIGSGNALGFVRLAGLPERLFPEGLYRPASRLAAGKLLRDYATCCMDSSDGLLATLDQLMRVNNVGFRIDCAWESLLAPDVLQLCRGTGTPCWAMAAAPHGEFELVTTVPQAKEAEFLAAAKAQGVGFIRLGVVQEATDLAFVLPSGRAVTVDAAPFRNLLFTVGADMQRYMREFLALGAGAGLE
ncbi:MAG: thiamine-phosphate kinase [candidate division WOR-3 bacterium]|nr:thiamine-phosphate kinase [candidate division WOR-3 bacterium]